MNFSELSRVIESVGKDKGVKREVIIEAIEEAIVAAAKKKYGMTGNYEATYHPDSGEVELFQFKTIVEDDDVADEDCEIELQEGKQLDPDAELGDEIGITLENPEFGRIDAQMAKQIIFQKIRDAEREIIFKEFIHRKGELITGIARSYERGNVVIDLGKANALLPKRECIPGESYQPGDRVQAYLNDVVMTNRGPAIYLSRTSPHFLIKLFDQEVPEINEGVVEIRAAAREPGQRAKIAVITNDRDVDPVGACVGMKGIRVQAVVQELSGEKIDIVPWSEDLEQFARSALSPAEIHNINIFPDQQRIEVVVEEDQLSLAIGRRGQNVRLAAMLTGWKVDIISREKLQKRTSDAIFLLKHVDGVSDAIAQLMIQMGIYNLQDPVNADSDNLERLPGFESEEKQDELRASAQTVIEKGGDMLLDQLAEGEDAEVVSASASPELKTGVSAGVLNSSKKDDDKSKAMLDAEERLREEFQKASGASSAQSETEAE
jgi:N utilization substance protein A